jgi:hypothetical protein
MAAIVTSSKWSRKFETSSNFININKLLHTTILAVFFYKIKHFEKLPSVYLEHTVNSPPRQEDGFYTYSFKTDRGLMPIRK